jgi:hypothetical protein
MSKKKRKTELRREDVVTYADKLRYSKQVWDHEQSMGFWDTRIFDFPYESEEWESSHYWQNEALRQRAANKLAKELGIIDDKKKR